MAGALAKATAKAKALAQATVASVASAKVQRLGLGSRVTFGGGAACGGHHISESLQGTHCSDNNESS